MMYQSVCQEAAINCDTLPCNIGCRRHTEKCCQTSDFLRFTYAPERRMGENGLVLILIGDHCFYQICIDIPGGDGVDAYVVFSPFNRQMFSHLNHCCLPHPESHAESDINKPSKK